MAELMNTFQAAEYLGVSPFTVRKLVRQGLLTAVVLTRDHLFRPEELDRYKSAKDGLNSDQVAELLGVPKGTIGRWVSEGVLPSRKVGWSRLFDRADLERFAAERGLTLCEPGQGGEEGGRRVG